jgi:uncharacterized RmlC-like cupin family protein
MSERAFLDFARGVAAAVAEPVSRGRKSDGNLLSVVSLAAKLARHEASGQVGRPKVEQAKGQLRINPMSAPKGQECRVIRAADTYHGKQGLTYFCGIAAETVGSKGICMHLLTIPPGGRAKAHLHESHETALYVLSGEAVTLYGDRLEHHILTRAGDLVYIPAGVPHLPINLNDEPTSAVIARTDPNEQESVVLLPELEAVAETAIAALRKASGPSSSAHLIRN